MKRITTLLKRPIVGALSNKRALFATLLASALPVAAFAGEANVRLDFSGNNVYYLYFSILCGVIALVAAFGLRSKLLALSPGGNEMQEVGGAIEEGALAYLRQQIRAMSPLVVILTVVLFLLYKNFGTSIAFIAGVLCSYAAGYVGMIMAVKGNMRTANAALTSYKNSLEIAFQSGAVAGLVTVGMGLLGASIIFIVAKDNAMQVLIGFGFGGSLAALFMRVGGGIFTKAADVGADLVGKVEAGIPEDDPRNPAVIADNVGDNVGDCAGMAADVFESYEVTLVAAIVLGAATSVIFDTQTWMKLILFALTARGIGILASAIGIFTVRGSDDIDADPLKPISTGFYRSAIIAVVATGALSFVMMQGIYTNKIVDFEPARRAALKDLKAEYQKLSEAKADANPQDLLKELQATPAAKKYGLDAPQYANTIGQVVRYDEDSMPKIKDSSEFRPVDLKTSPVGKYSVILDKSVPGSQVTVKPDVKSLAEFFEKDAPLFFKVLVKSTGSGAPAQENLIWLGPLTQGSLDKIIASGKERGFSVEIKDKTTPVVFADRAGKLAFGIDKVTDPARPFDLSAIGNQTPILSATVEQVQAAYAEKDPTKASSLMAKLQPLSPQLYGLQKLNIEWWRFFAAIVFGLFMAVLIERLTDYYVSTHKKPTNEVAMVSSAGAAPMIIQGFAYAAESSVFMVFAIVFALIFPLILFPPALYGSAILSFYGIALVGLGLLTTTGYVLAMDTFGPISDNAQGVYEMSGVGHDNEYGSKAVQRLDAAGNTTKALTKGFAIATAVVAAVALFHSYIEDSMLSGIGLRLEVPEIFLGLLLGGAAPFLFSASTINAVGRAAFQIINEVRRQFREDPGIMAGTSKPDYGRCVAIVTAAAQKELIVPAILAVALPIAVGFGFSIGKEKTIIDGVAYNLVGAQALGGFLAGTILSGQLMAVLLANSGGMWDNAKKLVEDGMYGGKGSDAHKAAVVCDTVGDPFKDTAGPALNPLIKVMNLVALLLAPVFIQAHSDAVLIAVTSVAAILFAGSIWWSKRGSMSTEMAAAHASVTTQGTAVSAGEAPAPKRTITVDDQEPEA